ncbi:NAD-specific glutamate dehydrogenase [Sphingopyxis sp. MC1]|nr:NAD-specific glutamate dehydrogenase [Sphingopyxis sp. MC1]
MLFLFVDRLAQLHRDLRQRLRLFGHRSAVAAFDGRLGFGDRRFDFRLQPGVDLVAMFGDLALGRVDQAFGVVLRLGRLTALLVLFGELFGVLDHLVDVGIRKAARSLDLDLLFLAGALVLRADVDDTVGVDVEGHLDLRHAARRRRDADQVELAEHLVVGGHFALALEDADSHRRLIVVGGRIDLALFGRDRRVAVDHAREHAAQRLDAKAQRGHVEQQHVLDVALQHARLDRRADGDDFIGVDAGVRFLAEEILHDFAHARHAGHAANQHDFVDLACRNAGVLDRLLARFEGALDQLFDQLFQVGAGDRLDEVLRPVGVGGDEGQVDLGRRSRRQFDLRLFGGFLQPLKRQLVAAQVDAFVLLEAVGQIFDDLAVEILAAQEGVAVGRLHLEHAVAHFEHRDVEGAAAKVIDRDGLVLALVETIGERGRGRLVDDTQHFEAGDLAGVLGRLALRVVEVSRNGDHRLLDLFAQIGFGGFLHLLKDEGADLRRRIIFAARLDPRVAVGALDDGIGDEFHVLLGHGVVKAAADQALHRKNGVFGIGDGLALCRLADQALAILGEGDDRRGRPRAFHIFDNLGLAAFHHRDTAVRGAEVDPDHFGHSLNVLIIFRRPKEARRTWVPLRV